MKPLLLCGWMGILACAAVYGAESTSENTIEKENRMSPERYEQHVLAKGGRVDFVFEDDRPFAECHASTLVEMGDGTLVCAWFGGTEEKDPDVGIWKATFSADAWSPCSRAAKVTEKAHWNPVLFRDPDRGVYLFFKVGEDVPHWQTYWVHTEDNGATWSDPVELVPGDVGGRGPVKNKPIILADKAWLAPASTELKGWRPFADRSEDGGKTWQRSEDFAIDRKKIKGSGAIQPTLWESEPGKVHALMRTAAGCVVRADSNDSGRTWTDVYKTGIPNNNSGLDALRLEDGRLLLVYNPVGRNWGPRTPLNLAVSSDNGALWNDIASLETTKGEYSYPSIVRTTKGIAISYTWKRERVRCWQIPLEAIE